MEELEIPTEAPAAPKLWDKKVNDLTVRDNIKLVVLFPIITIGGMAAAGVAVSAVGALASKIHIRKSRKSQDAESTDPVESIK